MKTILITGSTDGLGLETAKTLASQGHSILLHGRNSSKLASAEKQLKQISSNSVETYAADLSSIDDVVKLANSIKSKHEALDVLINNAGVLKTPAPITKDGFDVRFVVNTIAPYLLTQLLLPLFGPSNRIINLSSAAQAPVDIELLMGKTKLSDDMNVYAQSKLALTMWSKQMADSLKENGPVIISVNPGSLLATKMVTEGFGVAGHDINIGVDILCRLSLDKEFEQSSGLYFDNDVGQLSEPHSDALDLNKCQQVVDTIEKIISSLN